ncbi:MAG: hypothetical protein J6S76_00015 [Clostridia bacterium]|nr:hypothetical protein [Clostridia bacterium]
MNENNLLYRIFLNACVSVTIGLIVVLLEYTALGESTIQANILWYILASGTVVGLVYEGLFSELLPLSGNHLRRHVLWRNRFICALVNAVIVAVLGKVMLGTGSSLIFLLLLSVLLCLAAIIVIGIASDIRYRHAVSEMNRRLKQLNSLTGDNDVTGEE